MKLLTINISHHLQAGFIQKDVLQCVVRVTTRQPRTTNGFVLSYLHNECGFDMPAKNIRWWVSVWVLLHL